MKTLYYVLFLLSIGGTLSCSTVPDPYIPRHVGSLGDATPQRGLRLEIEALDDQVTFKQPVAFKITLQNIGEQTKWVPRQPHILFFWVYPTGIRDHYVRDIPNTKHFHSGDLVELPPGHQLVYQEHIETFYYPRPGITEFRAVYQVPRNTNSQITNVWQGRLTSNRYGVLLSL